jgi:basic membrane protein A
LSKREYCRVADRIPKDAKDAVEKARKDIVSGSLKVELPPKK